MQTPRSLWPTTLAARPAPSPLALWRPAAALLAFAVLAGLAATRASAKEDKDAPPPKSIRVAVLPLVNESSDAGAARILEDVLKDELKKFDKRRATFLMPHDVERILTDHDALDRAYRITDQWAKRGTLDSTAASGLDTLLTVDDVLCVKIADWESNVVHQIGAGESSTTVGLGFALYDVRTMARVWFKNAREQRFAQEIDPSSGQITYDETGEIQTRSAIVAPRYQDVAADLVRDAFKKFPQK
jgi:hypothetical protein